MLRKRGGKEQERGILTHRTMADLRYVDPAVDPSDRAPGVCVSGDPESANQDSFADGLLDCPHYTRPEIYKGSHVPEVLMSGNHAYIRRWRLQQALGKTWLKRPDLFELKFAHGMTVEEEELLEEFKQSCKSR